MTPLIVVALAAIFLKEVVHIYRWSAVIVGFCGVIVMLIPYMDASKHAAMSECASRRAGAGDLQCGVLRHRRHPGAPPDADGDDLVDRLLLFDVHRGRRPRHVAVRLGMPSRIELACLVGAGVCGGTAHIISTSSHHYAPASFLVSFDYSSMIWGFLLGYLFFGEVPAALVALGAAIVAGAGLFVVWRERQLGLRRPDVEQEIAAPRG